MQTQNTENTIVGTNPGTMGTVNTKPKAKKADTPKAGTTSKVKLIGPFADYAIKGMVKKEDKGNPMSFKTWAKKYAPNYDNDSTEALVQFRAAYDEDMREALRLKQDAKLAKKYDKDFKVLTNARATKLNDLTAVMRRLHKDNLINGYRLELMLGASTKAKKSIIFEIGYSTKGLAIVQASKRKKALMNLYMTRTV